MPTSKPTSKRPDTRKKMLVSAAQVMRERGAAGVTIDAVLARSGAPRGSVYYHFPDGRNQILTEALRYSGDSITAMIDDAAGWGARALLHEFVEFWERLLTEGDFTAGCPVVAAAIGCDDDPKLSAEAGAILGRWCTALTRAFVNDGFEEPCAASLAMIRPAAFSSAACRLHPASKRSPRISTSRCSDTRTACVRRVFVIFPPARVHQFLMGR